MSRFIDIVASALLAVLIIAIVFVVFSVKNQSNIDKLKCEMGASDSVACRVHIIANAINK